MKYTKYWLALIYIIGLYACQTQDKSEDTSQNTDGAHKQDDSKAFDNQIDTHLAERVFVYGLGCHWDSQSLTTGKLSFHEGGRFKFVLRRDLPDDNESDDFPDKFEVLEGKYIQLSNQNEVKFTFDKYLYKNIQYPEEFIEASFKNGAFPISQLSAQIDSCEDKISLIFDSPDELIPQEKYFNWIEKNHSGTYISYAEGVREELIIEDAGGYLSISYLSPSYQEPVALEVKANPSSYYEFYRFKVTFLLIKIKCII